MTDEPKRPVAVTATIGGTTLQRLAELLPAFREYTDAANEPPPTLENVLAFAVANLHASVFTQAEAMLEEQAPETEAEGGELWPRQPSVH